MAETITEITLDELPEKVKKFSGLGQVTTRKKDPKSGFIAQVAWYHPVKEGIDADIFVVTDTESEESYQAANKLKGRMKELKPRTLA